MENQFENLEALEQHFQTRLQEAGDDANAQLQVRADRGDALAAYQQQQQAIAQQRDWRTALAGEFPYADPAAIVGATEEEMRAAAEASHNHVQTVMNNQQADLDRQRREQAAEIEARGRQRYGPGAGVPDAGTPPNQPDPLRQAEANLQSELRKTTGLGARQPFDMREAYPAAEDAIFGAIANRQAEAQLKRMGGSR